MEQVSVWKNLLLLIQKKKQQKTPCLAKEIVGLEIKFQNVIKSIHVHENHKLNRTTYQITKHE